MFRNSRHNTPAQPALLDHSPHHRFFAVAIELDALMDSMTMLRGMTAHGKMYPGFTSDEITRFPSFDMDGSEWKLPAPYTFEDLLRRAIDEKGYFNRVRPYDFAERDITFLRRKNVDITIYVPDHWKHYEQEIIQWANRYFPPQAHEPQVKIHASDLGDVISSPDVWVARSPALARSLTRENRPFILFDGKENAHVKNGIRAIRWDQVGYALRHGEHIFSRDDEPIHEASPSVSQQEKIPPTQNIWSSQPYISPDQTPAALWVGDQKISLRRVLDNPDARLRWTPSNGRTVGKPLGEKQKKNALTSVGIDLKEIGRKGHLIERLAADRLHDSLRNPQWAKVIHEREQGMRRALDDLENELGIHPVTGAKKQTKYKTRNHAPTPHLTDRVEVGSDKGEIQLHLRVSDYIHLMTNHWDKLQRENFPAVSSQRAGVMAEVITVLMLQQEGWKVYAPRNRSAPHGKVDSLQDYTRVQIQWFTDTNPQRLRSAEIDCLALGPDNQLYVIEVKVSSQQGLSALQNELRNHLAHDGAILNPDVRGLDSRTPLLHPRHRVLVFDREGIMKAAKTTPERSLA